MVFGVLHIRYYGGAGGIDFDLRLRHLKALGQAHNISKYYPKPLKLSVLFLRFKKGQCLLDQTIYAQGLRYEDSTTNWLKIKHSQIHAYSVYVVSKEIIAMSLANITQQ